MASNNDNSQNTQQDFHGIRDVLLSHLDGTGPSAFKNTSEAEQPEEKEQLNNTEKVRLLYKIQENQLVQLSKDYEIHPKMLKHLFVLKDFEIFIVCDDSGSMNTSIAGSQKTRWNELCEMVKMILKIAVIFDQNGVDICFLNRPGLTKVKDPRQIDETFLQAPSGFTPLVPVLKPIFQLPITQPGRDKKLLVFIATDGEPTDETDEPNVNQLKDLMMNIRRANTTHVSFVICTDDSESVAYLDNWDRTMINVDVTDDYHTEREKIRRHRGENYRFTRGDYVVKTLVGSIVPELDLLNEPARNE